MLSFKFSREITLFTVLIYVGHRAIHRAMKLFVRLTYIYLSIKSLIARFMGSHEPCCLGGYCNLNSMSCPIVLIYQCIALFDKRELGHFCYHYRMTGQSTSINMVNLLGIYKIGDVSYGDDDHHLCLMILMNVLTGHFYFIMLCKFHNQSTKLQINCRYIWSHDTWLCSHSTHWGLYKRAAFPRRHFQMHFLKWKIMHFDCNFTGVCFTWSNQQYVSIGSNNALASSRGQANIWTNDGLIWWCKYASLVLIDLKQDMHSYWETTSTWLLV